MALQPATKLPSAVTRRTKALQDEADKGAAQNLVSTVVPLHVAPTTPVPDSGVAPALAPDLAPLPAGPDTDQPLDLENDAFLRSFMGDAMGDLPAPAAPAAAPAAPALAPADLVTPAPAAPLPSVTFEALFAADGVSPDVGNAGAPTTPPVAQAPQDAALVQTIEDMRAQIAALSAPAATTATPAAVPAATLAPQPADYAITADQREAYADSIPVIEKIAAAMVSQVTGPLMARVDALAAEVLSRATDFDTRISDVRGQTYRAQLYAAVPDIDTLVATPKFAEFVAQVIPYSGETVRTRLGAAHRAHDLKTVGAVMNDFRRYAGESGTLQPASPMLTPVSSAAPAVPSNPGMLTAQAKQLPWSRMTDATRLKNAGRMTPEEFNKVKAVFNRAEAEGRIDYNA